MAYSVEAAIEFKHQLFHLDQNTGLWQVFHSLPVNASENGDFNRGRKSFLTELKLTRVAKITKNAWTYMRENGVDSLHLLP